MKAPCDSPEGRRPGTPRAPSERPLSVCGARPPVPRASAPSLCAGYAGLYDDIAAQGWFIGLMVAVAVLTLALLTVCFVKRNRGGKYSGDVLPLRGARGAGAARGSLVGTRVARARDGGAWLSRRRRGPAGLDGAGGPGGVTLSAVSQTEPAEHRELSPSCGIQSRKQQVNTAVFPCDFPETSHLFRDSFKSDSY